MVEPDFGAFEAACFLAGAFLLAETVDFAAGFFAGTVALGAASFFGFAATFALAFGFAFAAVLAFGLVFGFAFTAALTFGLVFGLVFGVALVLDFAFAFALGADVFFAVDFNVFACTFDADAALDAVFDFAFCFGADFALALVLVADFATDFFAGDLRFAAIDHPIRYATKSCSKSSSERYQNISLSPSEFWANRAE